MIRCDYGYDKIEDGKVFIFDRDSGRMSVTNDAENVYLEITKHHPNHRVIYRDTMGLWDEIVMTEDGELNFKPYVENE